MENYNLMEKIISFLDDKMETPKPYGLFHILMVLGLLSISIVLIWFLKKAKEKTLRITFLIVWFIIFVFEIYKQHLWGIDFNANPPTFDYAWFIFPFQFCSVPLYLLPFIAFLKDGKVRDGILLFLGTYSLFAGLSVIISPSGVFMDWIGINIQTMIHHFSQIFVGLLIAVRYKHLFKIKKMLGAFLVFASLCTIAIVLDELAVKFFTKETFNMFFISRHYESSLPIFNILWSKLPYPLFVLSYLFGFTLCAFVMFFIILLFIKVLPKLFIKKKKL